MVVQKAKVHGRQFLKICSLKLCDIFSQNVYFYHILTNENFKWKLNRRFLWHNIINNYSTIVLMII